MRVHQIKIDFKVTEQIKRYVYVYLIEGKHCYLVDSGVAGSQEMIVAKLRELGRDITELKGIFLTHAHPDHIGTAAWFQEQTGCRIYASAGEKAWIEDIDLQYKERPIPNFYKLAGKSVKVSDVVKNGDIIELDEAFRIQVLGTAGHSADEVSYQMKDVLFVGDSIPVKGDITIYVNYKDSLQSLTKIRNLSECNAFYPAWDYTYDRTDIVSKLEDAEKVISEIDKAVKDAQRTTDRLDEVTEKVCKLLQKPFLLENSLFKRTISSHMNKE